MPGARASPSQRLPQPSRAAPVGRLGAGPTPGTGPALAPDHPLPGGSPAHSWPCRGGHQGPGVACRRGPAGEQLALLEFPGLVQLVLVEVEFAPPLRWPGAVGVFSHFCRPSGQTPRLRRAGFCRRCFDPHLDPPSRPPGPGPTGGPGSGPTAACAGSLGLSPWRSKVSAASRAASRAAGASGSWRMASIAWTRARPHRPSRRQAWAWRSWASCTAGWPGNRSTTRLNSALASVSCPEVPGAARPGSARAAAGRPAATGFLRCSALDPVQERQRPPRGWRAISTWYRARFRSAWAAKADCGALLHHPVPVFQGLRVGAHRVGPLPRQEQPLGEPVVLGQQRPVRRPGPGGSGASRGWRTSGPR